MRPHGLRARVILAAAIAIVAAVVLLALAVPALLSRQLEGSLDESLRARAADVARLAASSPDLVTERGALEGGGLLVQVVDRRGRIVARSGTLGIRVLPLDGPGRATLKQGKKTLALRVREPADATLAIYPTDPPPAPTDARNEGTRLIGFEVRPAARQTQPLVVDLIPGDVPLRESGVTPLAGW